MVEITFVGMTRDHFQAGNASRVRMIVLHATAGRSPGDYDWLRQGGSDLRPVSIHYYINKAGTISQMVEDQNIAWHAGPSTWVVDGQAIDYNQGCNPVSIGIELENLNSGHDPYPPAQYAAALWLTRRLVAQYAIPRHQLVRHLDIAPRRKTDPAGFAWERFVADVYATETPARVETSSAEALPSSAQLRKLLIDHAYRAAGSASPAEWPLFDAARTRRIGMPVWTITRHMVEHPTPPDRQGAAQDDIERTLTVAGQALILEAYASDLLYASPDHLEAVQQLSVTPARPLRDALLQALFRAADPVNGFQPDWAFHQFYLAHMSDIGVPIGPNQRLGPTHSHGPAYAYQHFALDTLCSPVGQWQNIIRLGDLTRALYAGETLSTWQHELCQRLLDNLYHHRTGHAFDHQALFCRYAITHNLGAPLGRAETAQLAGRRLMIMPFARDVLFCQIPANDDWQTVAVGELSGMLGHSTTLDTPTPGLLSQYLNPEHSDNGLDQPVPLVTGRLLGPQRDTPPMQDVTIYAAADDRRTGENPQQVIIYPAHGSMYANLQAANRPNAPVWHYYVDHSGMITHLIDEQYATEAGSPLIWQNGSSMDRHTLAIGVEGGLSGLSHTQAVALAWLIRCLMQRYSLSPERVFTFRSKNDD